MSPKIVIIGSANTDIFVPVGHIPSPGETVLGGDYRIAQGGKGANQAVAAARLGAQVSFITRLGRDDFGAASLAAYQAEGIDTSLITWDESAPSGVALIMVDQGGENIIAVAPGANMRLSAQVVQTAEDAIRQADCVLAQLEIPMQAVRATAALARKHGVPMILNPAPAAALPGELLADVDILTPNENELIRLAKGFSAADVRKAAAVLRTQFGIKEIVVTLGRQGALIPGYEAEIIPAYPVAPLDTTGAGDAFNGGLAVALARGKALPDAVRFANAVAALSTTKAGAQPSMPAGEDVERFIAAQGR